MRRRIVTRYVAVDAGLEVVEPDPPFDGRHLVRVKWDRRAQRRTRKAKGRRRRIRGGVTLWVRNCDEAESQFLSGIDGPEWHHFVL